MIKQNKAAELRASDPLFTTPEAADYLNCTASFLEKDRWAGSYGIKFRKIGGKVVYLKSDLDVYLTSVTRTSTAGVANK